MFGIGPRAGDAASQIATRPYHALSSHCACQPVSRPLQSAEWRQLELENYAVKRDKIHGVPNSLDDVIAELRAELSEHLQGTTCSWMWNPGAGAPFTISAVTTATIGVTIRFDQNWIHAEYFGMEQEPLSFQIPRLPNGEYDLRWDANPLEDICRAITTPLRRVRCQ